MLMHETKYQQCSSFVLGLGVLKLFITLNSYDWLKVHSVPDSISMVHQSLSNVYDPLMSYLVQWFGKMILLIVQKYVRFFKQMLFSSKKELPLITFCNKLDTINKIWIVQKAPVVFMFFCTIYLKTSRFYIV
jgi:hypothetical protein